jgi:hypothetical protein
MSRLARLLAVIAGLAFPVALALAVYVASAGSLAEPVEGTQLPSETIARPIPAKKAAKPAPTTPRATQTEDVSGPCDEAEHANDPRCTGAATDDDDDGSGSGSSGSSGDSSGSGSGSSDSSGGDDDSSGRGRGRSGSSGSGSSGSGDD